MVALMQMIYTSLNNRLKIFLLNDNLFSLAMEQQLLENYGYTDITSFTNSRECINSFGNEPDVILLHKSIESGSGLEILKHIKTSNPHIYVVITSSSNDKGIADGSLQHGAFDFVLGEDKQKDKLRQVLLRISQIQSVLYNNKQIYS